MQTEKFYNRHLGSQENEIKEMLSTIGLKSVDELIDRIVPDSILLKKKLEMDKPRK